MVMQFEVWPGAQAKAEKSPALSAAVGTNTLCPASKRGRESRMPS